MLSLFRIIKFAFQDISRNLGLSFMTVLILVLMLLSVNTLVVINVLTSEAVKVVKEQIDVSVYFNQQAGDKEIEEVKAYIKSFPEVINMTFLSRDEVLAQFREQHKDNAEILASLNELGENPLGPTLILKTSQPGDYQKIIKALSVPEYDKVIEAKSFGDTEKAIDRIGFITGQVEKFGFALSALFALIAFMIILNTIRVFIYTQRIEISIKKLVGATDWFVRGPYLFQSLFFTLISVIISSLLLWAGVHFLDPYLSIIFSKPLILTNYLYLHIVELFLIQFGAVLALTVLSSFMAMRKYLRV